MRVKKQLDRQCLLVTYAHSKTERDGDVFKHLHIWTCGLHPGSTTTSNRQQKGFEFTFSPSHSWWKVTMQHQSCREKSIACVGSERPRLVLGKTNFKDWITNKNGKCTLKDFRISVILKNSVRLDLQMKDVCRFFWPLKNHWENWGWGFSWCSGNRNALISDDPQIKEGNRTRMKTFLVSLPVLTCDLPLNHTWNHHIRQTQTPGPFVPDDVNRIQTRRWGKRKRKRKREERWTQPWQKTQREGGGRRGKRGRFERLFQRKKGGGKRDGGRN